MKCDHKPSARKKSAYGSIRKKHWCDRCDAALVMPAPNKKRARREAKKAIDSND